jgi:hypothetical protein
MHNPFIHPERRVHRIQDVILCGLIAMSAWSCSVEPEARDERHDDGGGTAVAEAPPELTRPVEGAAATDPSDSSEYELAAAPAPSQMTPPSTQPPPTQPPAPVAPTPPTAPTPPANPPPMPTMPQCMPPSKGPNSRGWCYRCPDGWSYDDPSNRCYGPCPSIAGFGVGGVGAAQCTFTPNMIGD